MVATVKQYPKFLAFLALFYPELYSILSQHSNKSDLVEAKLICSNSNHVFQAVIYSEDVAREGELLEVYSGKSTVTPYSWDWRWVFAVKLLFDGQEVLPIKFKQKVIALPTGKNPLSHIFFDILQNEYRVVVDDLVRNSQEHDISLHESYAKYISITYI